MSQASITNSIIVAHELGPFVDCTSNQVSVLSMPVSPSSADLLQAIAFSEISRPLAGEPLLHHDALIREAIQSARGALKDLQGSATFEEFVVQILVWQQKTHAMELY
jgi:hypothetical protein